LGTMESDGLASDLLHGAAQIANFMFGDPSERRRVYYLSEEARGANRLPCFRLGHIVCARKSTLMRWITEHERVDPCRTREDESR
jgi:hypothetical protein